ncbi:hypothetical protein EDD15DRAFT_1622303 [Pisolithus albus]|nr:hypothetical protein EDD15DRAFT_1622303 [Pisolithus albus]
MMVDKRQVVSPDTPEIQSILSEAVAQATTYASTNAAGATVIVSTVVTSVFSVTTVMPPTSFSNVPTTTIASVPSTATVSAQPSSSGSTPIAAIVGGVVGGVFVLVVIALLIYFIRRRSSKNEFDFEPDRITRGATPPQLDLSDEANNITPFNAYAGDGDEEMREHGESPFVNGPSVMGVAGVQAKHQVPNSSVSPSFVSYDSDGQFYLQGGGELASGHLPRQSLLPGPPQGAALPAGQYAQPKQLFTYDAAPASWHASRLGSSLPPSTVPGASASSGSTKEVEAAGERDAYGLGLAPQCEPREHSDSPLGLAEGRVVVHRDAGRAPEDLPHEIPPAYDSIQH